EDFDTVREFARQVAELLAARNRDLVTTEQRKGKRGERIYADIMRNAYAQLAVAPYSVRARPGAPVATPLTWDEEEDEGLSPRQFTIRTLAGRLRGGGPAAGPWAGMARRRTGLVRARASLQRLGAGLARRRGAVPPARGRPPPAAAARSAGTGPPRAG